MNNSDKIIALNKVLARNYDAEHSYIEAAEAVDNLRLETIFRNFAQQRFKFILEIRTEIRAMGAKPETGEILSAKIYPIWMNIKQIITTNDEGAILNEIKRGEEYALSTYSEYLGKMDMASFCYKKLFNQRNKIRNALSSIEKIIPVYES